MKENVYIHIGYQKTGTTFFQKYIFPEWKDVIYINQKDLLLGNLVSIDDRKKYLISYESLCGNYWDGYKNQELYLKNLASYFPQAKVIISFRRHDRFICSLYKQYLHEGGNIPFGNFFNIENDGGNILFKKESLNFRRIVELVESYFDNAPFIFLQEEIKSDLDGVLKDLELFIGGKAPNMDNIIMNKPNKGVGYYQSKLLILLNRLCKSPLNPNGFLPWYNMYTQHLKCTPRHICQSWLSFLSDRSLTLSKKQQESILGYFANDWNFILKYLHNSPHRKHFDVAKYSENFD